MAKELKKYQEDAIEELILKSKLLLKKDADGKAIVFKSPTGSGKTFTMSQYIKQAIEELREMDICFLWLSPGEGNLHLQSYKSLKEDLGNYPPVLLLDQEFSGSRKTIDVDEVVVCNWQKLSSKDSKTGEW